MYRLEGMTALVTGAGGERGLGRAIAMRLAEEGADVVVNDIAMAPRQSTMGQSTTWGGLSQVVREIEALGRRSQGIVADVGDATQVQSMVQQVVDEFGQIDILVNNAGTPAGRDRVPVVELEEAEWDRVQRVNIKGTFLCAQAAARAMIAKGNAGKIINISSTAGKQGIARYAAYCSSKFAVIGFTQSLTHELGPHGINVNAVCPGLLATERIDDIATATAPTGMTAEEKRAEMEARTAATSPLGRMAQVRDVAAMVAFLASAEADYLTGLAVPVAGGAMMH